NSKSEK
ncbi:hypothetical protein D039_2319B, partial [Vibrio parahaemolyticus EKP-028]